MVILFRLQIKSQRIGAGRPEIVMKSPRRGPGLP